MIHSSPTQPKNAVRHGLSSTLHVPEERIRFVEHIRMGLIHTHQPKSAEERDCISELALARWKASECDRQMDLRAQSELLQAGIIFDRQMIDQFETDEKLWHSNPRLRRDLLGQSFHGASLFEQFKISPFNKPETWRCFLAQAGRFMNSASMAIGCSADS